MWRQNLRSRVVSRRRSNGRVRKLPDRRQLRIEHLEDRRLLAAWTGQHGDLGNTGRADYVVPAQRLNDSFFDVFRWQTRVPGSPTDGTLSGTSMPFFDGVGPGGADIVVGGYHWPKGVQGMDRHTGEVFWFGNPDGGESIGVNTPAFSNDGSVIYVTNDATPHPLMAFPAATGPSTYWHNGGDADPQLLGASHRKSRRTVGSFFISGTIVRTARRTRAANSRRRGRPRRGSARLSPTRRCTSRREACASSVQVAPASLMLTTGPPGWSCGAFPPDTEPTPT